MSLATTTVISSGVGGFQRGSAGARPAPRSDEQSFVLVRAVQHGHTEAFGTLYEWYHDDIRSYLHKLLGDRDRAEDFASETFLRALASIDKFAHDRTGFPAWLTTIARNVAVDFLRSRRAREVCLDAMPERQWSAGADDDAISRLEAADVRNGVDRLPASQRECVRLRFLKGWTVAETADALGRTPTAVRQLQCRAIRNLATLLNAEHART